MPVFDSDIEIVTLDPTKSPPKEIAARAEKILRDFAKTERHISYPLAVEDVCKFKHVFVKFAEFAPAPVRGLTERNDVTFGPYIFIPSKLNPSIFFYPMRRLEDTAFFIATQFAHIVLHLPKEIVSPSAVATDKVTLNCKQEAAVFARALLMPQIELKESGIFSKLQRSNNEDSDREVSGHFGVSKIVAGKRIEDLQSFGDLAKPRRPGSAKSRARPERGRASVSHEAKHQ